VRGAREAAVRGRAALARDAHRAAGAARRTDPRPRRLPRGGGAAMRPRWHVAGGALALLALLAHVAASAPPAPALQIQHRTLESSGGRIEAESGQLMVPENRAVATSRRIPIRFLWLKSTAAKPRAPLFYLAGGPGDRAVFDGKAWLDVWAPFLSVCDVVLID